MAEKKVFVVVSSRKSETELTDFNLMVRNTAGMDIQIVGIENPEGLGLTIVYNHVIPSLDSDNSIVAFIHDDIEFLKKGWAVELRRLFAENEDYGIIGVAGSKQFNQNAAWWMYDKKYGQVLHQSDGKTWLTKFSPLLKKDLEEVAVIDGLFIGVDLQRVTHLFSDEIIGFNFYDIDFCLKNYVAGLSKIGVTTNIRVAHKSVGKLSQDWYDTRKMITEKYWRYYPIDVDTDKREKNKKLKVKAKE